MSDHAFDALRASGEYPPKGWGWKDTVDQRRHLEAHFQKTDPQIDHWMIAEAKRLGVALPPKMAEQERVEQSFNRSWLQP